MTSYAVFTLTWRSKWHVLGYVVTKGRFFKPRVRSAGVAHDRVT